MLHQRYEDELADLTFGPLKEVCDDDEKSPKIWTRPRRRLGLFTGPDLDDVVNGDGGVPVAGVPPSDDGGSGD